jgi:hypothetical protein
MIDNDYDTFDKAINELACCYLRKIEGEELAAYFKKLSRYPIELVVKAMEQAAERYPTFFPNAGQLIEICDDIAAKERFTSDAVALIRAASECEHEYLFEPEPEGGLYLGFEVCVHCERATPVVNHGAPPVQLEYFRMAVKPQGRSEE